MKYHSFNIYDIATLIIIEKYEKEYIWVYLYLDKQFRNGYISIEFAKYALYHLKGLHQIHWLESLTSFKNLVKELKCKPPKKSNIFADCNLSLTNSLDYPSPLYPLFNLIVKYKMTLKKPIQLQYATKKDQKIILETLANI